MNETNPSYSGRFRSSLSLRAKLALAFVIVSMIGFVVAFLIFPSLYVRSKNRAIEQSRPEYAHALRQLFWARVIVAEDTSSPLSLVELAKKSIHILEHSEAFALAVSGLDQPVRIHDLIQRINPQDAINLDRFRQDALLVSQNFSEVWIFPYPYPDLNERLSMFYRASTGQFFLPIVFPLEFPDYDFKGSIVFGNHLRNPLEFHAEDSQDPKEAFEKLSGMLWQEMVADIIFLSPEEIEANKSLMEGAREHGQEPFWEERSVLTPGGRVVRMLCIPVDRVSEPEQLAGIFCVIYKPTFGLVTLQELTTTEAYLALAVAALLAIVFSVFFARSMTRPLSELTEGALLISEGKLDQNVRVSSSDEIGILAETFNEMRQRLRQTLADLRERAETIETQNRELDRQFNELRALQNYTENILATVEGAIFSVDLEGYIRRPNRACERLLGLQDGQSIESLATAQLREKLHEAIEEGESTFSEEMAVITPEGEKISTALSVSPLLEDKRVLGAVAVITDLQDIKNLEALVRRQERLAALGELTAGVAHEIRNPLSIIKACADILRQRFAGQPGENGLCTDIIEEVDRLSRVVSDFLSFARPSEPNCQPVVLSEIVRRTAERLERDEGLGTRIRLELEEQLPAVDADIDQVEQVLLNLIRNGSEAMKNSGVLTLRTGSDQEQKTVWVEVEDQGEGMEEATLARLFDPFFTTKAEGTGLGLSICHRIMDSHDGGISVTSVPGKGTTFRIAFPCGKTSPVH
jgi:PAS domain S-box-containing protein